MAVLLGVLGCLATGSAQSFAAPALPADVAPAASPASEDACGDIKSDVFYSKVRDTVWAWAGITNSCRGWDKLCATLYYGGGEYVERWCQPLFAGYTIDFITPPSTCITGWYYGRTTVHDGATVVKQVTSKRKYFSC